MSTTAPETDVETAPADTDVKVAPPVDDEPLGDKGRAAIDALRAEKREERKRRVAAEARVAELEALASKPTETDGPDLEAIRAEGRAEATAKANERLLRAEIKAAATGKFADPTDPLAFLDLSQFEIDPDGNVNDDEIADALSDLLKKKPQLAVRDGKRFQGSGDGGARDGSDVRSDLHAQIAQATKSGNHQLAIRLRQELAASLQPKN